MSVGAMNERVTLQAPKLLPNGQGGAKVDKNNPVIIGTFWAAVEVISGMEAIKYGGRFSENYIKVEARKNSGLNKGCQVIWKNILYAIEEITPAKNKGNVFIYAREAVK